MFEFDKDNVFVIAEIGGNHEGDFKYACKLLELAARSGADAAKFQVYSGDRLVSKVTDKNRNEHFKRFELAINQYEQLAKLASELGIMFMASIWDCESLERLNPYITVHKIGSGDLNAYDIVEATVRTGKPIIQSCGLANIEMVEKYVEFVESVDPSYISEKKLCLLQCTSMYPIPEEEVNLNAMQLIQKRTQLPVGYSDHTVGTYASEIAVAMGAKVIEMHFTDNREGKEFRDHKLSVTQNEMREFVDKVRQIRVIQGKHEKEIMPVEIESNHHISFRRGLYPVEDLDVGVVITRKNIMSLRPNVGIDAQHYFDILGKKLKAPKKAFEPIFWNDLDT